MKKFILFLIIVAAAIFWVKNFVLSGRFEKYLDSHPNPAFNAKVEYIWGIALNMAGHNASSLYRLQRAATKYEGQIAADAWAEYIRVLEDTGARGKASEQSALFLEKYPNHEKADTIRRKMSYYHQGL